MCPFGYFFAAPTSRCASWSDGGAESRSTPRRWPVWDLDVPIEHARALGEYLIAMADQFGPEAQPMRKSSPYSRQGTRVTKEAPPTCR